MINGRIFSLNIFDSKSDWKIHIPDRNIYIMKDHSWAFAAWEHEKLKGNINSDSVLLHFDYHLDDVSDGLLVDGAMDAQTKDDLFSVTRKNIEFYNEEPLQPKIQIDNFIWPSFARGTISTMFSIAPQDQQDFASWMLSEVSTDYDRFDIEQEKEKILKYIPIEKFKSVHRTYSFEEFKKQHLHMFYKCIENKNKILDLDLDYFISHQEPDSTELMPKKEIQKILSELLELCEWDLITVALSPSYCGGDENAEYLLNIFLNVAKIRLW
ncbi:hypothetical protein CN440_28100 [Bacillus cereus]|nr:hypothetical protein [Bacillus cereus]PEW04845.1 hypothetical protein CN440_28100 [Bacillus cereus]